MRRCGSPSAQNTPSAARRRAAVASPPGSLAAAASKASAKPCSALVLVTVTLMTSRVRSWVLARRPPSGRLGAVLGVAALLEFERELLAAAAQDLARRHHVDLVGHDVVEKPLVMRDEQDRALRRAQRVDALGHHAHRVD